jgi:hypothetical protein
MRWNFSAAIAKPAGSDDHAVIRSKSSTRPKFHFNKPKNCLMISLKQGFQHARPLI